MNRVELVLIFIVAFAIVLGLMWLGWKHRGDRQSTLPELPAMPADPGTEVVPELTGLYVGTTTALHWQDRIVARGLGRRADAVARLTTAGAVIERQGSDPIFIPRGQLTGARLEPALAGKVVGQGGLLVLRWQHGEHDLDTGLRADDKTLYPAWLAAIEERTITS